MNLGGQVKPWSALTKVAVDKRIKVVYFLHIDPISTFKGPFR
jgi:hypothetical protein